MNSPRHNHRSSNKQAQSNDTSTRKPRRPRKWTIVLILENGSSFEGTAVAFDNPNMPKCKVFFKLKDKKELSIPTDIDIRIRTSEKVHVLQTALNNYLSELLEEARLDFPVWLEKYSTRAGETNPFFNLDEIREEYKYKKSRFGVWRMAALIGFYNDTRPQFAKFNKIMHFEIRDNYNA